MGLLSNISEFFASNTYVQATEHSIATNELENSIEDLNGRYKLGHTLVGDYIKFGVNVTAAHKMQNERIDYITYRRHLRRWTKLVVSQ